MYKKFLIKRYSQSLNVTMKQHEVATRNITVNRSVLFRSRILVHGRRDAVSRRQDWLPRAKVKRSCNFFWFRSASTSLTHDTTLC